MKLPIEINTWQDWFEFRYMVVGLLKFIQPGKTFENWPWIDHEPRYRWEEHVVPTSKLTKLPSKVSVSVLVPFKITGLNFKFGTMRGMKGFPWWRWIYVTLVTE